MNKQTIKDEIDEKIHDLELFIQTWRNNGIANKPREMLEGHIIKLCRDITRLTDKSQLLFKDKDEK